MTELFSVRSLMRIAAFAADYMIIIWFFSPLENRTERRWSWTGFIVLSAIAYLYYSSSAASVIFADHSYYNLLLQFGRLLIHWAAVSGYLLIRKEIRKDRAVYHGGVFTIIYLTALNFRFIIILLNDIINFSATFWPYATLVTALAELLLAMAFRKNVRIPANLPVSGIQWFMLALLSILSLFFKWSLTTMEEMTQYNMRWIDIFLFDFIAVLGTFLIIFLFEINQQSLEKQKRTELEQVSLNYEMQNAKRALQTNNDIRRLYHDMKNHLLAIRDMSNENGKVNEYLQDLLPRFEGYESQVSTGSPVIDALLSEKIQRATLDHIQFNVYIDLSSLTYIKPVDLITIFGNAVDNGIEAVRVLPEEIERIIYLKSSVVANMTILRFSNQFTGTLQMDGTDILTTKPDKNIHGIGLNSIRKTVSRYGGSVRIQVDNHTGWFDLFVTLPSCE